MKLNRPLLLAACLVLLLPVVAAYPMPAPEMEKVNGITKGQLQPPAIFSPSERSEIRGIFKMSFSWGDVPGAAGYHIVVSRDRRFEKIIYENSNVPDSACIVDNLGYGTYFYKISSVAPDGSEGPASDVRTFIIVPPPPPRGPEPGSQP